jgi:hypothetical protein
MDVLSRLKRMPMLTGAMAALVALAAGILSHLEALVCLERAAIAFGCGWVFGGIWHVACKLLTKPSPKSEIAQEGDGKVLNVSESRVYQLHTQAMNRLRNFMRQEAGVPA